ncbi:MULTISPECIES: hypothetical protein [Acinetobacter]|uniref:Uncharacterized protein n=1 Tax=Acinetobacter thutiue TaxID=2998078 RepID=A0ABT7WRV8_9GAMM|nr:MULTISPECIES: hypothetical protein [Acinetobacter]MCY6413302.1 hypothetical protein [Acinetobacter thutiue]MDH0031534.1 hypothetical protein [Acinetobacter sp. GD04021]MDH0886877.1 hypothetical protein [Acinetobacter sp. GD03873]MDH1083310.1 hypothetical protein [Acinetobacter sp. GD03983]MDH2190193.1 hypothetical protein [Acinetobacter sp. GD03645]
MCQFENLMQLLQVIRHDFGNIISFQFKNQPSIFTIILAYTITENWLMLAFLTRGTYMINNKY